MNTKSRILLGLAASVSLAALGLSSAALAQSVLPAPSAEIIGKTYSKADEENFAELRLISIRGQSGSGIGALIPKGAKLREIRFFGSPQITGIQLVYEDRGALYETAVGGMATPQVAVLTLTGDDRVASISTTSSETAFRSIVIETTSGKKVQVGTPDGATKVRYDLPGELLGFQASSNGSLVGMSALIKVDSPMAKVYLETLGDDGEPTYSSHEKLGYVEGDKIAITGGAGIGGLGDQAALIPKNSEIARLIVYGDQTIRGLQLAYRSPGSEEVYPTALVGQAMGKKRAIKFAPGEEIKNVIMFWTAAGIHNLLVEKNTGATIAFGGWNNKFSADAGLHGQSYTAEWEGQPSRIIGFRGDANNAMLTSISAIRLPVAAGAAKVTAGPNKPQLTCSEAAAQATTASGSDAKSVILARAKGQVLQRQFASIQLDDQQAAAAEQKFGRNIDACRFTIDGVWTTKEPIILNVDLAKLPDNMEQVNGTALIDNGNYSSRQYMIVSNSEDPDNQVVITDGLGNGGKTYLNSNDGIVLGDLLKGKVEGRKLFSGSGMTLTVNLAPKSKSIEIRILRDGMSSQFYRPSPKPSPKEVELDDTFVIGSTLDNLSAARRGYDITREHPFLINQNLAGMWPVFKAPNPRDYVYTEKQAVPLGLWYVPDALSGMVATDTLIMTETDYQKSVTNSYGASLGYGSSPNQQQQDAGKKPISASVSVDYVKGQTQGMREGSVSSMALAIARTKKYAVVVNHAFNQLEDDFVDDLYDAAASGSFEEFIKRYGTHYPYAVTYGAGSQWQETFDQQSAADWASENESLNIKVAGEYKGVSGSVNYGRTVEETNSNKYDSSLKRSQLLSICTGGAVNNAQQGEKDCPVLLDLRPIYELVSPMYFSGDDNWMYLTRLKLTTAVERYLANKSYSLSEVPETQFWQVGMPRIKCTKIGFESGNTASLRGSITFGTKTPLGPDRNGKARAPVIRAGTGLNKPEGHLDVTCDSKWVNLAGAKALTLAGTATQISQTTVQGSINWLVEVDGGTFLDPDDDLVAQEPVSPFILTSFAFKGDPNSAVGTSVTETQEVWSGSDGNPALTVEYSFKRIR